MYVYLVRIYRDETGECDYCTDDNYYCAGLYSTRDKAEARLKIFEDEIHKSDILEIEMDVDIPVRDKNYCMWDSDEIVIPKGELWLGGGSYYE